jgi:exodeoxyribonuclease III
VTLRLLSYNIRHGGVEREDKIAGVIRECAPDIVVLQEATHPEVVERVAKECGMEHWGARYDYSLGFISRLPVEHYEWHKPVPLRRAFLEIKLTDITVFGVHLSAVHSNLTERLRKRELRALLKSIEHKQNGFHVLAGDFNTLAPGEPLDLRRLPPRLRLIAWVTGGRVRYETIQIMLDGGYIDGYRSLCYDKGFTFPTWDPHVRLDFAFLPARFAESLSSCEVIYDAPSIKDASDHFPILAEINT